MIISTEQGTVFSIKNNVVTITRAEQPECSIPLADLREFVGVYFDLSEVNEDEDEDEDEEFLAEAESPDSERIGDE
jgi:hypothetical protein